jgi:hypothetical protein
MPALFALSDIALRRLKIARFGDLNDPFELLAVNCRRGSFQAAVREHNRHLNDSTGVLSFSRNWTNPVLWSHYAEKHTGVCLGFNLRRGMAEPVSYADERLRAKLGNGKTTPVISESLQKELLRTKFSHWKYEEEVRVIVPLNDAVKEGALHFYRFGADLELIEVILGERCSLDLDEVRAMLARMHKGATAFRTRLAVKWFAIVPNEVTVPTLARV